MNNCRETHQFSAYQERDIKEFYLGLSAIGEKKKYSEVKHYRRRKRWLV